MQRAFFVYGNHGKIPTQIEDFIEYFEGAFYFSGLPLSLSERPVPNQLNILLEMFDPSFCSEIQKMKREFPKTRFVCVVTEFITGQTFNDFRKEKPLGLFKTVPMLINGVGIAFARWAYNFFKISDLRLKLIRTHPGSSNLLERVVEKTKDALTPVGVYSDQHFWQRRFNSFCSLRNLFEEVWCVTADQVGNYENLIGMSKVKYIPIVPFSDKKIEPKNRRESIPKDIDFLFSGTITPHREKILSSIKATGSNIQFGPSMWPSFFRDHFVSRTKLALHLKQSANWKFPSVMRYHYFLIRGVPLVAEEGLSKCLQENYIKTFPLENFAENCAEYAKVASHDKIGEENLRRYFESTFIERSQIKDTISALQPKNT